MTPKPLPTADNELSKAADLWADLAEAAKTDKEAEVFLMTYGPWVSDQVRKQSDS